MIEPAASRNRRRRDGAGAAHLDAWDRYGRILAAQLAVLEEPAPDLGRFRELAGERDAIAREIDALEHLPGDETNRVQPTLRDRIKSIGATDQVLLQKLRALSREVGKAVGDLDSRRPGRMGYLAAGARQSGQSVDVTS